MHEAVREAEQVTRDAGLSNDVAPGSRSRERLERGRQKEDDEAFVRGSDGKC